MFGESITPGVSVAKMKAHHWAGVMVIDGGNVAYLAYAGGRLGVTDERSIAQRGERITDVATPFALIPKISAHRGLRPG